MLTGAPLLALVVAMGLGSAAASCWLVLDVLTGCWLAGDLYLRRGIQAEESGHRDEAARALRLSCRPCPANEYALARLGQLPLEEGQDATDFPDGCGQQVERIFQSTPSIRGFGVQRQPHRCRLEQPGSHGALDAAVGNQPHLKMELKLCTKLLVGMVTGCKGIVSSIVFSPDGNAIASGGDDGLALWQVSPGA